MARSPPGVDDFFPDFGVEFLSPCTLSFFFFGVRTSLASPETPGEFFFVKKENKLVCFALDLLADILLKSLEFERKDDVTVAGDFLLRESRGRP